MAEKFEQKAPEDTAHKSVAFDASQLQKGVGGNHQQQQQFDKTLSDLGAHPTVDQLAKVFPKLLDQVQDQYKAAAAMQPPEQSIPIQWQLNDLHDPAWKLEQALSKDPGKLGVSDAKETSAVLQDYADGRKSDKYGTVDAELNRLSAKDPRVGDTKSAIDKIMAGPYKSAYDAYRTKYIPFVDSQFDATEKAMSMQNGVDDHIFGVKGAATAAARQQLVGMHRQLQQLTDQYVLNRY